MKRFAVTGMAAALSLVVVSAVAQQAPPSPEEQAANATSTRQAVFKLMGFNMGPLGGMARNRVPYDAAVVQKNAARMETLGGMIPEVFQMDTRQFQVQTEALERVWNEKDDFTAKAGDMVAAAKALGAAAAGGDQAATLKAIGALGQTCGACHDLYRKES